jgi:hypothetical protein
MSNLLLYELLPGIYRELDEQGSGALQALLNVIEDVRSELDLETTVLYDNWFAETCDAEALPRIASLVGVDEHLARRSSVANAIATRRRKGTFAALERALFDASGWIASASLAKSTGPNLPIEVSISAWRQPVFEVTNATPCRLGNGFYTFHPMGINIPLFHLPEPNYNIEKPCTPSNLPFKIELNTPIHQAGRLSIAVISDGKIKTIPRRFGELDATPRPLAASDDAHIRATIDPSNGLFHLAPEPTPLPTGGTDPMALVVSYACAFSSDLGATSMPHTTLTASHTEWLAYVHHAAPLDGRPAWLFNTLQDALNAFSGTTSSGTIRILDSATYHLGDYTLQNSGCAHPPGNRANLTLEALPGQVPCLTGSLRVAPSPPGMNLHLHNLCLNGAIHAGGDLTLTVTHCTIRPQFNPASPPGTVRTRQTRPVLGIHSLPGPQPNLRIKLESSICGPIRLPADCPGLTASDTILESFAAPMQPNQKADSPGAPCHLIRTSVLGSFSSSEVTDDNSIFLPYVPSDAQPVAPPNISPFMAAPYGHPDYARLRPDAPAFYLEGATNGSERGAFNLVEEPRRTQQFNAALIDFMPADIMYDVDWKT